MSYTQSPSPNHYSRSGYSPELIVVHCTDGFYPSDLHYLQNPNPPGVVGPVSAHFLLAPTGGIHQLVDESRGAWHAGRVQNPTAKLKKNMWGITINPNKYSIGIEVSMRRNARATNAQMESLKRLIKEISERHNIPIDRDHVIGHREIFSGKTCPGTIDVDQLVADISAPSVPNPPVDREEVKKEIKRLVDLL